MLPGLFFYWTAWVAWIIITFFMEKGKLRTELAFLVLMVIFLSNRFISIHHTAINISLIPLLLYSYRQVAKFKPYEMFLTLLVCQVATFGYIGFTLYAVHEPAIQWLDLKWMSAILLVLIILFTVQSFSLRCLTSIISAIHGNLLYAFLMDRFSLSVKAGTLDFLDMLAASLGILLVWHGYGLFIHMMNHTFKKTNRQRSHYTK